MELVIIILKNSKKITKINFGSYDIGKIRNMDFFQNSKKYLKIGLSPPKCT